MAEDIAHKLRILNRWAHVQVANVLGIDVVLGWVENEVREIFATRLGSPSSPY